MSRSQFLRTLAVVLVLALVAFAWLASPRETPRRSIAPAFSPPIERSPALIAPVARVPSEESTAPTPPAAPVPEPLPEEPALRLRQDVRWLAPVAEPEFAKFREWTQRVAAVKEPAPKLIAEGLALVEERRQEMSALIDTNPRRALELAVPVAVRRTLPTEILQRIEEPVSGRGNLWVAAALAVPGNELTVRAVQRTVVMKDGRQFDAFTFGARTFLPTKADIAVQGIALDGKLALSDLPGRVLEPVEAAERRVGASPTCPTSGLTTAATPEETAVDFGGTTPTFFCGPSHAYAALVAASGDETTGDGELPIAQSGYTEGVKKMLCIRVDFPDAPGEVVSTATLTTLVANMAAHWDEMSFGRAGWFAVGSGSAITPTLRMPLASSNYTNFGTFLSAARSVAADAGYNYQDYNFDVLFTASKPSAGFAGIAYVGGRGAWLANSYFGMGVCSHEVGHNFGLNHAGFWDADDNTTTGAGSAVEYGNPFDHMGGASNSTNAHFGARQKNFLDWLPDADVQKITANGTTTTRISAFDKKAATGKRAIAVDRTGTSNDYWIEYRQTYTSNGFMLDGAVLNWGDVNINNGKPLLLDWAANTGTLDDCPLLIGRTFSDTAAGIHLTPVGRGTTSGISWMDVTVNRGPFTGNQKPVVNVTTTNLNPGTGVSITCTAAASDPDADTLAYFWEWGDGTYTANNSASAAHSWSATGTKTVRCRVTDMKGHTATGQLLVQVGTSTTFFIQGSVLSSTGTAIENATVSSGAASDVTDSEGYYAITGLSAGSYTLTATKTGLTINPNGFTNPVAVGPSRQNINFVAPPGAPIFATMKAGMVDQGSNTGDVILPVTDPDTAAMALTLTGVSSNTAIVPNASIVFGTSGVLRTVRVTAAANVSGLVNITITATDPQSSAANYVWPVTVNAKPVLTATAPSTPENAALDIDLRTMVTDDLTPADKLRFELSRVRGGSASLLADGHTARFTPAPNYHGAASFSLTVRDQSLSSRTLFLYDFEPPDTTADGRISDQSNFNRIATFEIAGTGAEYSYQSDAPAAVAPYDVQAVNLTETGTGGARIRKTLSADEHNYNDTDWTFSTWVKRASRDTDDYILHLGEGDGEGTQIELQLRFVANTDTLRFGKYGAAGLIAEIVGPDLAVGTWHHVALAYDRTATNTGTFELIVDGFSYGTAVGVAMDLAQTFSLYLGGTQSSTASLARWFDGRLDDALFSGSVTSRAEIWNLAHMGTRHTLGLAATSTVNVTVTGTNQPPAVSDVADLGLLISASSGAVPFTVSDAEAEARAITVTASSSNTTLIPNANVTVSAAPAAWASGDIGTVSAAGSLIEDHGTFLVSGSGADIGGTTDEFRWVREDLTGDGEFSARIVSMDYANDDAKAGVMLRESAGATGAYAAAFVTPAKGVAFHVRASTGAAATVVATVNAVAAPCFLKIARAGTSYTAFYAADNNGTPGAWQPIGTAQTLTFTAAPNQLGMAVTSHADGTLCTAVFDRLGGSAKLGGERTVTVTPAAGQQGTATITLTANDGAATATDTFLVTVSPNTPPTIDPVSNVTGTDGISVPSFTITVGDVHTPNALTVTATSSNNLLLPANRITISGTGTTRTVTLAPIASETGTATVTLTVSDGAFSVQRTFTFTVNSGDPSFFVRAGANWRYLDTGANPASWQMPAFNDAAWSVGPAQLGFGEGDEGTAINATTSRIVTYFRHGFQCANPAAYTHLKVRLLRDDGAVLYLNGVELYRSNIPAGAVTASTQATVGVSGADENAFEEVFLVAPPLVAGVNVLAVSVHQKGTTSSDLSFDLEAQGFGPSAISVVPAGATWKYLDTGVDPGATWMTPAFADTAWLSGPAQLGYGDDDEATTVASGPTGAHYITTYFRHTFQVADPSRFARTAIRLIRDDGAVIYLNGLELTRDNMAAGAVTTTTPALVSATGANESAWQIFRFDSAWLVPGANTIAVEIHQLDATSSDISFDLELLAYAPNSLPTPTITRQAVSLLVTWPNWATGWLLKSSPDLQTWSTVPGTPADNGQGQFQLAVPFSGAQNFFRLDAP